MSDVIALLPDSVANQIAAGEVIQRPGSVVKELLDNAVDASSTRITLVVKDAGRTLIQVIDNGIGMSDRDALMAFERHATSKITSALDLFAIRTLGFRGEALASIAAVAEVTLISRKGENELGTEITMSGSVVKGQRSVSCPVGSNFSVLNLFYNIPARRKFLKSNTTELGHIITEFNRIAIAFPSIEFCLIHNDVEIHQLTSGNLRQRILQLFGKSMNQQLIDINNETSLIKIYGFTGKPELAKKKSTDQYFFVNQRFMRHPYFHRAVLRAYDKLIAPDAFPAYFIFFEIEPDKIDVNIHPTKTEIKFEDEQSLWQIVYSVVKESLGKFVLAPSIDFENSGVIDIPVITNNTQFKVPSVTVNPDYNPFEDHRDFSFEKQIQPSFHKSKLSGWDKLFPPSGQKTQEVFTPEKDVIAQQSSIENVAPRVIQLKNKYILTAVKSGLMVIDQKRAHERILYEIYFHCMKGSHSVAQEWLYPVDIQLNHEEYLLIIEHLDALNRSGFHIEATYNNTLVVKGQPAEVKQDIKEIIENLLEVLHHSQVNLQRDNHEILSSSLAKASAIPYGKTLTDQEMQYLIDQLFACSNPNYTYEGKAILQILSMDDLDQKF